MTVKEMGAARRKLGGLLALSQSWLYGKSSEGFHGGRPRRVVPLLSLCYKIEHL